MTRKLQIALYGFVVVTSTMIALYAFTFQMNFTGDPLFHARFATMPIASFLHIVGGGIVLLLGGFQFSRQLRSKHTTLHRNMGRVYLIIVALGGVAGLILATSADGGLVARFGFTMLAVLWLFSGLQAYLAIRRGEIKYHQAWMLRNFSLTFAAVTLRIYLGLLSAADVPFEEAYPVVAWLSWVPNLILVEWYLVLSQQHNVNSHMQIELRQ